MAQSRTTLRSDLAPCRLPTALFPTTWLVVVVLLLVDWFFNFDNWMILRDWLYLIDWSSCQLSAALNRAFGNRYFPFPHGPLVYSISWPLCPLPTASNWSPTSWRHPARRRAVPLLKSKAPSPKLTTESKVRCVPLFSFAHCTFVLPSKSLLT